MKFSQLLIPEEVVTNLSAATLQDIVSHLVSALAKTRGIDAETAMRAITARERLGPTLFLAGPCFSPSRHCSIILRRYSFGDLLLILIRMKDYFLCPLGAN